MASPADPHLLTPYVKEFFVTIIESDIISYFFYLFFLSVFLVVFFDKNVITKFFSKEQKEYGLPFFFYLFMLMFIQLINEQKTNTAMISTIFFITLFIILLLKFIGLNNVHTGNAILQILGGFALIRLILEPIENLETTEPTSLIIFTVLFSLFIIFGGSWREKVVHYYKRFTNSIIELLIKETYLFSWDEIPGNDNLRLRVFLKQEYNVDWVETANIEKIDDGMTIRVYVEKKYLSLSLNNEKTKVNLKIDDDRNYEFIARIMNGILNIYKKTKPRINK